MKKNKSRDQPPADFKNSPFKALKGLEPTAAPAHAQKSPAPERTEKVEDDTALFLRSVQGVKTINSASGSGREAVTAGRAAQPGGADRDEEQLFLQAIEKIGTARKFVIPEPETDESPRRSQSGRMRQLKRGTIRIREELDLHGDIREVALAKLEHFIAGAFDRGQKAVLVITGKGINSSEGPVLQGAVAAWLREKGKGRVAEFAPAPRDLGGSGAFVVFLKIR
jgi:DNA-nicking Smr family endonuclease